MALAGCIIQANLNHSAAAQDLLLQVVAERGLGLEVVAEPYRIPPNNGIGDTTGRTAIIRAGTTNSPAITEIARGEGFVVAKWGEMSVVGLYVSPNAPISSLQRTLDSIRDWTAPLMKQDLIVMGDFNAKSTLWGSPRTNPREEAVEEWAAELDLQLLNDGRENTCVRWQGESKIDLTWASPSAARKVRQWQVETETETLSDHRYILISLEDERSRRNLPRRNQEEDPSRPRWAIKRMDKERLITAAQATAWAASSQETTSRDAERKAEWFQAQMIRVCDASMPRVRNAGQKATYW